MHFFEKNSGDLHVDCTTPTCRSVVKEIDVLKHHVIGKTQLKRVVKK